MQNHPSISQSGVPTPQTTPQQAYSAASASFCSTEQTPRSLYSHLPVNYSRQYHSPTSPSYRAVQQSQQHPQYLAQLPSSSPQQVSQQFGYYSSHQNAYSPHSTTAAFSPGAMATPHTMRPQMPNLYQHPSHAMASTHASPHDQSGRLLYGHYQGTYFPSYHNPNQMTLSYSPMHTQQQQQQHQQQQQQQQQQQHLPPPSIPHHTQQQQHNQHHHTHHQPQNHQQHHTSPQLHLTTQYGHHSLPSNSTHAQSIDGIRSAVQPSAHRLSSQIAPPALSSTPHASVQNARSSPNALQGAAPGPIPATTPVLLSRDEHGVQCISFEYSRDRIKVKYTIRCNTEAVELESLSREFKEANCVYPRACSFREGGYRGNRLEYETQCNSVGWALAALNPELQGKRGLIQRAVDSWRNTSGDSKLRSRRVRRLAKNSKRAQQQQQQQQQQSHQKQHQHQLNLSSSRSGPIAGMINAPDILHSQMGHGHHINHPKSDGGVDANSILNYRS